MKVAHPYQWCNDIRMTTHNIIKQASENNDSCENLRVCVVISRGTEPDFGLVFTLFSQASSA